MLTKVCMLFVVASVFVYSNVFATITGNSYDGNFCKEVKVIEGATSLDGFVLGGTGAINNFMVDNHAPVVGYEILIHANVPGKDYGKKNFIAIRSLNEGSRDLPDASRFFNYGLEGDAAAYGNQRLPVSNGLKLEISSEEGAKGNRLLTVKITDKAGQNYAKVYMICPYY